jgi:RNA polymerase sigma-70 factor (ECF subfamily)
MARQGVARPLPCPSPTAGKIPGGDRSGRFKQRAHLEKAMSLLHDLPTAEEVCHTYAPRVYSLALRMLGNTADAEDVTQDVLLQVVRKLDTFRGKSSLPTWLHRVTVNAALAHRRRQARRPERHLDVSLDCIAPHAGSDGCVPDRKALDHELRQNLEWAIARLPELYRDVFVLADVEELPNTEIGQLLRLSLAAVKSRLHRARLMVREALALYLEMVAA